MSSFNRYQFSDYCASLADKQVYPNIMGNTCVIERFMTANEFKDRNASTLARLDKAYGVDAVVTADSGRVYTISERFRGAKYEKYQEITIRLGGKHSKGAREFNKTISRFLLFCFVDSDAKQFQNGVMPEKITSFILIEMQPMLDLFNADRLPHKINTAHDGSWSFAAIKFDSLYENNLIRCFG